MSNQVKSKTVLVLGGMDDSHATFMLDHLAEREIAAYLIDSRWFPRELGIWYDPKSGDGEFRLPDQTRLPFDAVHSIYWRCYNGVLGPALPDPDQTHIAENDARGLFEAMLLQLPVRWVNGFDAYRFHQTKAAQLATVAKLGVAVPDTLLTNEPETVRDFYRYHKQAIYKPVQGGAHTRRLTPQMLLPERLRHLQLAPITVQQEIEGTNVRVFVAGRRVMACEIRTRDVDFRDDAEPELCVHVLPDSIRSQCLTIANALHLCWTGIDFRLTPDGEYFFLEANPSPMFLGFEEQTGLPLTAALTELLLSD